MPRRKLDPLPAAAFQILLALAEGDLHGYGIMRRIEEQTEGRTRLGPGTLYSSIQALLEEALIEELESANPTRGRARRFERTQGPPPALPLDLQRTKSRPHRGRTTRRHPAHRPRQQDPQGGICLKRSTPACCVCIQPAFASGSRTSRCNSFATGSATSKAWCESCASGQTCLRILSWVFPRPTATLTRHPQRWLGGRTAQGFRLSGLSSKSLSGPVPS